MEKLKQISLTTIVAVFIVVFGLVSLVFIHMEDIVLGLVGGYISAVVQFLFGSSKGSEAKDKTISDMTKNAVADGPPLTNPGDIDGGGVVNQPPKKP